MSQSLYEKIRPTTFSGLVGQENVKKPLVKESINDKWFRVKMFYGVRGTGKTTVAKTVLMAANCTNKLPGGDPCGCCNNCKAILTDSTTDFVELDAASNNSVEDARKIIEEISYPPRQLKYRSYIIDECHMLSQSAFNALLKTCEHVPESAFIIFCTTEFEKVPDTLKSRAQKYEFMRLSTFNISNYLKAVADKEGIKITDEACSMIARRSDGVMRSALVDLESLADPKETVTGKTVSDAFGLTEDESKFSFLFNLVSMNEEGCLRNIEEYEKKGKNPVTLVNELLDTLKDIAIFKNRGDVVSSDEYQKKLALFADKPLRRVNNLSMLVNDMRDPLRYDPSIKNLYSLTIRMLRELEKMDGITFFVNPVSEEKEDEKAEEKKTEKEILPVVDVPVIEKRKIDPEEYLNGFFEEAIELPKATEAPAAPADNHTEAVQSAQASVPANNGPAAPQFAEADYADPVDGYYGGDDFESFGYPETECVPSMDKTVINEGFMTADMSDVPFEETAPTSPVTGSSAPASQQASKPVTSTGTATMEKEDAVYPPFLMSDDGLCTRQQLVAFNILRNACEVDKTVSCCLRQCKGKFEDGGLRLSAPDLMTMSTLMMLENIIFGRQDAEAKKYIQMGINLF